ncbi:hypothetical protein VU05_04585 [Desulfobulbus sp. F1]|nr:hypothetical protein [Desulfobulbus sp. F1]
MFGLRKGRQKEIRPEPYNKELREATGKCKREGKQHLREQGSRARQISEGDGGPPLFFCCCMRGRLKKALSCS